MQYFTVKHARGLHKWGRFCFSRGDVTDSTLSSLSPHICSEESSEGSKMPKGHHCPAGPHVLINNHSIVCSSIRLTVELANRVSGGHFFDN